MRRFDRKRLGHAGRGMRASDLGNPEHRGAVVKSFLAPCLVAAFFLLTGRAESQSVKFSGQPLLRWYYANGQWYPVYNPGAVRLPAQRPPYVIPPGVLGASKSDGPLSPRAYVIGSPEWRAKFLRPLPPSRSTLPAPRTGFRYKYVYRFGPDGRYRLQLELVPR